MLYGQSLESGLLLNCNCKHGNLLLTVETIKANRPSINSRVFGLVFNVILLPLIYVLSFWLKLLLSVCSCSYPLCWGDF